MTLVENAGLSTRTTNALMRGGYYTMDDVCIADSWKLRGITEFGDKAMREVKEWAAANGKVAGDDRRRLITMLREMEKRMGILERDIEDLRKRLA
jgi:DNA-directed RNA polymerase alpha subunit